jgi:hypothetical protein
MLCGIDAVHSIVGTRKISTYVKNGSKTAVMDVIRFVCRSLGISTAQRNDSLGSRRECASSEGGLSSQNADHA